MLLPGSCFLLFAVALHDVKKMYNAAKAKLGELKAKVVSQSAAAAPPPQPPPPLLLVAAKSFAASHSLPTLQPDDPNSFFAAIEALISMLERNLSEAKSQAETAAKNALKTPPQSPPSNSSAMTDLAGDGSGARGLSRLSISPISGSINAEREASSAAAVSTFASITGSGAFTSPKKAAVKQTRADVAVLSASVISSATSAISAATTTAAVDAESIARIQLHNIDLQRRVERLQMSMKVVTIPFSLFHNPILALSQSHSRSFTIPFSLLLQRDLCYPCCRASKAILLRLFRRRMTQYAI
jgi:hypothetical protein